LMGKARFYDAKFIWLVVGRRSEFAHRNLFRARMSGEGLWPAILPPLPR
jgi:hypothetical protein